jgi:hypothetical protein
MFYLLAATIVSETVAGAMKYGIFSIIYMVLFILSGALGNGCGFLQEEPWFYDFGALHLCTPLGGSGSSRRVAGQGWKVQKRKRPLGDPRSA